MNKYYFQCDVKNNKPEIERFGKRWIYRLDSKKKPTTAIVLVRCTEKELSESELKAGKEGKTLIILSEKEIRKLALNWEKKNGKHT
jgi:hypothetical protein